MNVSLMRLSSGERRGVQVLFHVVLPVIAMGLFWIVLYESVMPVSFPLAWGAITWAVFLVASTVWTWRVTARVDVTGAAGRTLGTRSEAHALPADTSST
jgi:hypothetical protein